MGFDVDFSPADVARLARVPNSFLYEQKSIEMRAGGIVPGFFGFGEIDVLFGGLLYEADLETATPLRGGEDLELRFPFPLVEPLAAFVPRRAFRPQSQGLDDLCHKDHYGGMKRTTIMLPADLRAKAEETARREGTSFAEVVRESLARYVAANESGGSEDSFLVDDAVFDGATPPDLARRHDDYLYDRDT